MDHYNKFYSYLQELEQSYSRLSNLLRQKLVAIERFDINRIDEILKEEQVYVLLSKGFEANIQSYRDQLSLSGTTLAELIPQMPEEIQPQFHPLHERLRAVLDESKGLNEKCQSLIQERLHSIDKSIKQMDQSARGTYQKAGGSGGADGAPKLFTKTI